MQKYIDFIGDNLIPFAFTLFMFILLLVVGGVFWAIGGAVFIFAILYLKQNVFNPLANKWVKIGGIIVFLIWILILILRVRF